MGKMGFKKKESKKLYTQTLENTSRRVFFFVEREKGFYTFIVK
jgi:hypothetical protein